MRVDEFDFALPEELIALRPVEPRSASRLLVSGPGGIADSAAARLAEHLRPGDILVFNDTSVIPARLSGARVRASRDGSGRAAVEATLIRRLGADLWEVLARPGRKLAVGDRIEFAAGLAAILEEKGEGGAAHLRFDRAGPDLDAAIGEAGMMPLPPYIAGRRAPDARDEVDYQSIFAERPGAVAAPTASLHFDAGLLAALEARGVLSARLTLHVGAGTFLPVKSETLDGHRMHSEWGRIDAGTAAAINAARAAGGRAIPVGTTALRLMESAAREEGGLAPFEGETDIFIHPGHRFRAVDGLMTNFHLPRSTLLMLVAALIGVERTRDVYAHAIAERYRFYSYGDASLLFP